MDWIGKKSDVHVSPIPVESSMIKYYTSMLEDDNPVYWDEEFARQATGGLHCPPGMLMVWKMPKMCWWLPADQEDSGMKSMLYASQVPLPEERTVMSIDNYIKSTFHRPIRPGDQLSWQEKILDVSEKKSTRLGDGHFVTSVTTYKNQRGEVVAENEYALFRYGPDDIRL